MVSVETKVRIVLALMRTAGKLPLKFHYFCGDVVSWMMKNIFHYRRDVIVTNIARSFPEKPYSEIRSIANMFYRHLGEIAAEAIWFGASDYKRLRDSGICRILNLEVLKSAYEANDSGVTLLCSHCGNWELLGGLWGFGNPSDYPDTEKCIKVVYKRLHNPVWDEVFKRNRQAPIDGFDGQIETYQVLRYAVKHRNDRNIYIFPADQYPYAAPYPVGTFLSQNTYAMLGSVALANKMGMSVVYMKMKHLERGRYEISFEKLCDNASEHRPEDILRKYFDSLEAEIRETPYNWLWSHKRWK